MSNSRPLVEIAGLKKTFGDTDALKGIDINIHAGEIFGFLGPNGAGKTTTIKIMCGLLKPTAGRVLLDGIDVQKDPLNAKRTFGYIPDRAFMYPKLTGREFLAFVAGLYGIKDWHNRTEGMIHTFELEDVIDQLTETYSHGMRQRLAFIAALLPDPKILVVDEPVVGLDPKGTRLIKRLFKKLAQSRMAIFMSTHIIEIAEEVCTRIAIIDHGEIIAEGAPQALKTQAQTDRLESVFLRLTGAEEVDELMLGMKEIP